MPPRRRNETSPNDTRSARITPVFLPPAPPIRSDRAATVARWFGLTKPTKRIDGPPSPTRDPSLPFPLPGTITLITGPSGAGKSTLLRSLMRSRGRRWIDVTSIALPNVPLVDCLGDVNLVDVLRLLSRVGLGEAWTYLRTPAELSDGQRWRAKLAIAMHRAASVDTAIETVGKATRRRPVLVADEFAAVLDRVTALIVARALRRAIDAQPDLSAIVATSHADLARALCPDTIVHCDFGRRHLEKPALK